MVFVTNGSNTRTTTTVRDGECLMKVKMTNVSSDKSRRGEAKLSVHVSTVHVYLTTIVMNSVTDRFNTFFKHTMSRWIGDHDARKLVSILLCLFFNLLSQDVSILIAMDWDDFHAANLSSGRVSSVSRCWA